MDFPVSGIMKEYVEVVLFVRAPSQERVLNRTQEQIMGLCVLFMRAPSQERVLNRTQEQIMDFPVPRIMEAAVEVVHAPQECVQNRTPEQLVDEPVPQIAEEIVERPHCGTDSGAP